MIEFGQTTLTGSMVGGLYALVALGFVLIYKSSKVLNFAQGAALMILSYVCWSLIAQLHLPIWIAFIATLVISAALGLLMERFFLRPLIAQPLLAIIMMTIALSALLEGVELMIWQSEVHSLPNFIPSEPLYLGSLMITQEHMWCFIIAIVMFGIFTLFFTKTKLGLGMRCVAEDYQASQSLGIKITTIFASSWVIAFMCAAIGGVLLSSLLGVSYFNANIGLKVFPVVLIGGLESITGAIVGGIIVGILEALTATYLDPLVGGGLREVAPYIVLLIVLLVKPYGLFGLERIERI